MIDLGAARETFEGSADFTVGIEEEFALIDPDTLELVPRFELLRDAARDDPLLSDSIAGELISSEIEIRSGAGADVADARVKQAEARRRLFALARANGVAARRHRHARAQRLPRAARHRHGALPPRRGRPEVRRLAQQHVLAPRARRRRAAPTGPCGCATACGRCCRSCSRSARTRRTSTGATPACTPAAAQIFTKSFPRCGIPDVVRLLGGVGRLRRAAGAHALDRRVHAAVVVGPPAPRVRHRRGAHLRRADDRHGGRRAGRADRRLRAPRRRRGRRGRDPAGPPAPADRGEHVARDPLRPGRAPARSPGAADRGVPRARGRRPPAGVGREHSRSCPSSTARSASGA